MRFFPGGNTAAGFCSRFGGILPEPRRTVCLKGGPGVGKSSLMKRVAAAHEAKGRNVEYYHCSSDPDSLDAIAVPELGFMMLDGTAPHVIDPTLPGARDEIVNLGIFLDVDALRPRTEEITRLSREIAGRFERAYGFLAAAANVRDAACRGEPKPQAVASLTRELAERLPLRGGYGSARELFAEAHTPKGLVSLLDSLPRDTVFAVDTPFGCSADTLLRSFAQAAQSRGLNVVLLLDPLRPERLAHVAIPAHGVLLTTSAPPDAERVDGLFELSEAREESFDRNAFELLLLRATEQLRCAKSLHDALESVYTPAMDFLRWEAVAQSFLPTD